MKIYKPIRVAGPWPLQLGLILFLSALLGGIYAVFQVLPETWWFRGWLCLPAVWLFCFIIGSISAFRIRHYGLEVTDIQSDEEKESIRVTIRLIDFPQPPIPENKISVRFQTRFGGGFPIAFKHQTVIYHESDRSYTITADMEDLFWYLRDGLYIYVKPGKCIPRCAYLLKFNPDWQSLK